MVKGKLIKVPEVKIFDEHYIDKDTLAPEGGVSFGHGFCISWQRSPLGRGKNRKEPNGAFVEDILTAALKRLYFYQRSKFKCELNQEAIHHIHFAILKLRRRTADRIYRKVEGTHKQ